jgi:hypothetical protein
MGRERSAAAADVRRIDAERRAKVVVWLGMVRCMISGEPVE